MRSGAHKRPQLAAAARMRQSVVTTTTRARTKQEAQACAARRTVLCTSTGYAEKSPPALRWVRFSARSAAWAAGRGTDTVTVYVSFSLKNAVALAWPTTSAFRPGWTVQRSPAEGRMRIAEALGQRTPTCVPRIAATRFFSEQQRIDHAWGTCYFQKSYRAEVAGERAGRLELWCPTAVTLTVAVSGSATAA